ncbi:MAG: Alpha/beta hydrolase fold protein [Pedosphaera sp.]|nr:Alpha/beta hydrolase fold protein [Pedosphaera sp.]
MQLNYRIHGTGFPLIILHGLFGSSDNWQTISRKLGEHFQVFAVDLRNHGNSPHSDVFNYEVMAEDLLEFMESHGLSKAHVLGHSMGGKMAMQFALQYPDKVEKLIVVDIAPKAYPPWHVPIFEALLALDLTAFHSRKEIDDALTIAIPETPVRQFLLKNLSQGEDATFKWKLNLRAIYQNYERLNRALPKDREYMGPVLFIRGGQSDYVQDRDMDMIRKIFPQAVLATVQEAGHWVHAEKGEEVVEMVLRFIR